jgi:microcystin-dependent protein
MASTYSTNLRTELIGSGDQAGTWGTTTNTSLGSILEQAIAGVSGGPYVSGTYPTVNFPTDADITLTANNGSVDQSRSMVLVVTSTGSLTATRNVIAPASASKVYIIKNSTTGGQSIQIKYATGTGITVGNGATVPVYGDGSNFYTAVTNTVPAGSIQMWATGTAPTGYVLCNGAAISRTAYPILFGVIGTTFGVGDGSTTFNVPNYQGYMPIGAQTGVYNLASNGGSATTTLATANLPTHTHTFNGGTSSENTGHTHNFSGGTSANNTGHVHNFGTNTGYMNSNNVHSHSISDPGHSHGYRLDENGASIAIVGNQGNVGGLTLGEGTGTAGSISTTTQSATTGISVNSVDINHTHYVSGTTGDISNNHNHTYSGTTADISNNHNHTFSGTTDGTGSGTAFNNLPPYLAISFIIKT